MSYKIIKYESSLGSYEYLDEDKEFQCNHHLRLGNEDCIVKRRGFELNSIMYNVANISSESKVNPEDVLFFTIFNKDFGITIDKTNYKEFIDNNQSFINFILRTKDTIVKSSDINSMTDFLGLMFLISERTNFRSLIDHETLLGIFKRYGFPKFTTDNYISICLMLSNLLSLSFIDEKSSILKSDVFDVIYKNKSYSDYFKRKVK